MGCFDSIKINKNVRIGELELEPGNYQSKGLFFEDWGNSYEIDTNGIIRIIDVKTDKKPTGVIEIYHRPIVYILEIRNGVIINTYDRIKDNNIPSIILEKADEYDLEWN